MNLFKKLFQSKAKNSQFITIPFFTIIDINNTKEYYDVAIEVNNNTISLDLNFIETAVPLKDIENAISFLNKLPEFEKFALTKIKEDFNTDGEVKNYIEHHLEEFNEDELMIFGIDSTQNLEKQKQQLLNKLHIKRIGIYPEDSQSFAVFDYTLNDDLTQYLIVARFNSEKELVELVQES